MGKIVFNILGSLVIITLALFPGCKKDQSDGSPPRIEITNPYDSQSYTAGDTIYADFSVSDNSAVSSISFGLVDANMAVALNAVQVTPAGNNGTYHLVYPIYDLHLASAVYYVKVTASDGYNSISRYQKINLSAIPKVRKGYYYVTRPLANLVKIWALDTNLVSSAYYSLNGDLVSTGLSSYTQDLFTCGMYTGNMSAVSLLNPALKWSIPVVNNSIPYFEGVYNSGVNTYVSFYSGQIKGYDQNGSQRFNAAATNNYFPMHIFRHGGYIAAEAKDVSSSAKKIILFYVSSGQGYQECVMTQDVAAFFTYDTDNIFVMGNNGNQGVVQLYQVSTNGFWSPITLAPGKLLSAVQVDANTYLIAHSNGTIYKYTYSNSSIVPFITGVVAAHMSYDDVNQEVLVSEAGQLKLYNYANAGLINSTTASDSVCGLHVLFNR
jgi:hypothetical protein